MSTNVEGRSVSPNDAKPVVRRSFSSYMIEMHNFFLKTSPSYMAGTPKLKYLLQFPRAYCRFMYYSYMDWRRWRNCA